MRFPNSLRRIIRSAAPVLVATFAAATLFADEPPPAASSKWDLPEFIARLPEMLAERLPGFDPEGAVRLYVRPHFGDFIHRDYVRVPVGARAKVSEKVETSVELESYFTHGLSDAAGYGLSNLSLGAKCEHVLPALNNDGISLGANFITPVSRPPVDLNDGHRHFQPYVAATHPLVPAWRVLGYASISADILNHTALAPHFGRNQLHSNSLTYSAGVAREWSRFHGSLTASVTSSTLMSDESKQVYALRPEIVVPWKPDANSKTQVLFTLGGRAIHGPDGNEFGGSGSVRVEFQLKRDGK